MKDLKNEYLLIPFFLKKKKFPKELVCLQLSVGANRMGAFEGALNYFLSTEPTDTGENGLCAAIQLHGP